MSYIDALEEYIAATNSHDFKKVQSCLDAEAVYWFSDTSCTTMDEIQQYFEHAWNTIKEEVYSVTDVQWLITDNCSAVCIYTYCWEGYHEGSFQSGSGRATNVFRKNAAGSWKLIHEHLSSN